MYTTIPVLERLSISPLSGRNKTNSKNGLISFGTKSILCRLPPKIVTFGYGYHHRDTSRGYRRCRLSGPIVCQSTGIQCLHGLFYIRGIPPKCDSAIHHERRAKEQSKEKGNPASGVGAYPHPGGYKRLAQHQPGGGLYPANARAGGEIPRVRDQFRPDLCR